MKRTKNVVAKLNLVILAGAASGVLWIESAHRIRIEVSTPAEVAVRDAAMCPENESVPFSADCMKFIQGTAVPDVLRASGTDGSFADSPEQP
jgi:hypothetical protein